MWPFVSGCFHLAKCFESLSTLWHVSHIYTYDKHTAHIFVYIYICIYIYIKTKREREEVK
jgi:hypothetical protein